MLVFFTFLFSVESLKRVGFKIPYSGLAPAASANAATTALAASTCAAAPESSRPTRFAGALLPSPPPAPPAPPSTRRTEAPEAAATAARLAPAGPRAAAAWRGSSLRTTATAADGRSCCCC